MRVQINGEEREVGPRTTVADLVAVRSGGVAVAVNGTVVPRAELDGHVLAEDDVVEVVTAVQGG